MKSEFLIKEQLNTKKRCVDAGKDLLGNPLSDKVRHDLIVQSQMLRGVLED